LFNDLNKSEKYLNDILIRDPLLINEYKSTKGLRKELDSFDDRAFIKVKF
jgi:hypothetical protein